LVTGVFISPRRAQVLLQDGAAPVDARSKTAWIQKRLPGSGALNWLTLRDGAGRTGLLDGRLEVLCRAIRGAGVHHDRPVVVYGKAGQGWGEEGRIYWMLEHLGHSQVHILDGGIQAWEAVGRPMARLTSPVEKGDFEPQWGKGRLKVEQVILAQQSSSHTLWDTRTQEEFEGATPYGEARPGHIPGARHLHWKALLDGQGRLLPEAELRGLLQDFMEPVVPLCTGGVRAAFAYAVLRHLGVKTALYDGSMWEWAKREELPLTAAPDGPR
jgi:thiosulfate/3-mercaptopyruvate sulfurtransferase